MEYSIKKYLRHPKTLLADPALALIHPLGKSPVITIEGEDGEVETIAESGAIVEYLIETYGQGQLSASGKEGKEARKDRIKYLYWLHFAEVRIRQTPQLR